MPIGTRFYASGSHLKKRHGRSHALALFRMSSVPCDDHIRPMPEGGPTDRFDPVFADVARDVDGRGGFRSMRRLGGRMLVARDGSEHFRSRPISGFRGPTRRRSDGETADVHRFVGACPAAAGPATVVPPPAEFGRPRDAAAKQDGEPMAGRRWLDRFAATGAVPKPVDRKRVAEVAAWGRARWTIENESFDGLKTGGHDLEHDFGHGSARLASPLVVSDLLAFAMHRACDLLVAVREDARKSSDMFRTITADLLFPSWQALLRTILIGRPPPEPRSTTVP